MDWNKEISTKLLEFHRGSAEEYRELIKDFNIYAYGYGYKVGLLKEIFPGALEVNMRDTEPIMCARSIYEYFGVPSKENDVKSALLHINSATVREESEKIVILCNARKDILDRMENVKIILVQSRGLGISHDEIIQENFVLRDLSTFIFESKTKSKISTKIDEIINVYDCVGPLSQKIFKLVLKTTASKAEFSLRDLFSKEKKKLLIVNYSAFRESLAGFFDAKILTETNGICKLHLPRKDLAEIIGLLDSEE
ncbi:hypothetical protein NECID01_0256 [Nematocida sp. AWRm77]|nr:hypothetical protein NECID01_0256 [Nematocida sp. AWRm77]